MNLSKTLLCATILAATAATADVIDDAKFRLDLRGGENGYKVPGDVGNAFDFSSATPCVGYMGDFTGAKTYTSNPGRLPQQLETEVVNPWYVATTNTQYALHFFQDQKSATASARTSVCISNAAVNASTVTFYVRFKWEGVAPASTATPCYVIENGKDGDGWKDSGVALYIDGVTVSGSVTNAYLGFRGAKSSDKFESLTLTAGTWTDAFMTFTQNADNTKYTVSASICKAGSSKPSLVSASATKSFALSFATPNIVLGGYHNSSASATTSRGFRGAIADFMVWDRALTNEEKIEVMAGQHGAKWRIGAINGSADEFTDDAPAAIFDPQSMPWRQMRKTLDASHPTLTLKSQLETYEAGKAMILSVTPLLSGVSSAQIALSVNNTAVGTANLENGKTANIVIPKNNLTRDASGNVTLTLNRTGDTSGSVCIDAITLSGSWQITDDNNGSNGMTDQATAANFAFAGDTNVTHFTSSLSVGNSSTNYTFGVFVPAGMGEKCGWKFRTKTTTIKNTTEFDEEHTVFVNGVAVGTHAGRFTNYESFSLDMPVGTLHDGMNYVQWAQTLPVRPPEGLGKQADGVTNHGIYQFYDFWAMDLVPPANPFVMIMR